jgi:branched-chain amino acid aminotransferase
MAAIVNVNGRITDQEHAAISVFDHGFLYGEGIYETLRTYNGEPFLFDRHMRRLRNSAKMLALQVPLSDAEIDERFRATMRKAGLGDSPEREAYIRILVTRGIGELTYEPAACPDAMVVVIVKPNVEPSREAFERGVTVALVGVVRNHPGRSTPDQVEQPVEQRAGDAGSVQPRRLRRRDAELPRRAGGMHAVELVHRQGRRGADAAD